MADTEVVEGEILDQAPSTGLALYFDDNVEEAGGDEDFIFENPEDNPLDEIGGGIRRIRADGSDGVFYDDKESLGKNLDVVVIDMTSTKHFWVPDTGKKPELDSLLAGFPKDKPICYNTDQFHEQAKLHRDLTEDQIHVMRSKGAGASCNDCKLFKDCGFGRDLLVMGEQFEEPFIISFPATSAIPLREFFRKEFKFKGQSIALPTYPIRLTFPDQKVEERDPATGKVHKYFVVEAKRGRKLPNEQTKAYLDMREQYRISNRRKHQNQIPGNSDAPSTVATAPRQARPPVSQPVGDPAGMSEEEMF